MNWDGIISLLFFCIEFILLLNVLYFSWKKKSLHKGVMLITLLAGYQLVEYLICGIGLKNSFMAFAAFAVISFLPPLNLLFILEILKKRFKYDWFIFIPVTVLLGYYLMSISTFKIVKCSVLYAAYTYPMGDLYGLLYYLPLLILIVLLFSSLKNEIPLQKKNAGILLTGNIFTALPVVTAFILNASGNRDLLNIIESIMCKFAIVLALCYSQVIINLSRENKIE